MESDHSPTASGEARSPMDEPRVVAGQAAAGESGPVAATTLEPPTSLWQAFKQIGPGLILAGAIVGTGELIATTNLGAKTGFALLWLVIVSCFIKVFAQIELGRYTISSGENAFQAFRRLPGPGIVLVWWCGAMLLVTQSQIGAMIGGIAQAVQMVAPLPRTAGDALSADWPWAVVIAGITIAMLVNGSYRLVERTSTLLVAGFTLMTVACVVLLPVEHAVTGANIASGLKFAIPTGAVIAAFTMFGITGVGASELLAYPTWCLEKGYARHVGRRDGTESWARRARGWMAVLRLDAWFCMVVYTVATLAFYLLGAAVLHKTTGGEGLGGNPGAMIGALVGMYAPVLGPRLATLFVVFGAFCVLYSTLFAATAGNCRMLADFLGVVGLVNPEVPSARRRAIQVLSVCLPSLGLLLYLRFGDPVALVTVGAVMQGLSLPLIAGAALYLRYCQTDRRITPGLVWDVFLWLSVLGLTLAAAYTVFDKLGIRLFG